MNKVAKDIFIVIILVLICALAGCKERKKVCVHTEHSYMIDVSDDSIYFYSEDNKFIGSVKSEGQADSLIIADNQ
jgi:hypothetical protein